MSIALGIDIGTSKVAAVILQEGQLLATASKAHCADFKTSANISEQNPTILLNCVRDVVLDLPSHFRNSIEIIGVTGQMHGVMLHDRNLTPLTPLITWQDRRCLENGFVDEFRRISGYSNAYAGYGCMTLAWQARHGQIDKACTGAATIQDWIVAKLCGTDSVHTDPTNAASWGLFDLRTHKWDLQAASLFGIDSLLPCVMESGSKVGRVSNAFAESVKLPEKVPVCVAVGDNQASVASIVSDPEHDIVLTLGTGGQVAVIIDAADDTIERFHDKCDLRPYFGHKLLAVGACLSGGSAWLWLAQVVESWLAEFGEQTVSKESIFEKLNSAGLSASPDLKIKPHFLGERNNPCLKASIEKIDFNNFSLGVIASSLAHSIILNLHSMMPWELLGTYNRIILTGNAFRKNQLLRKAAENIFKLPLLIAEPREDAAYGAAIIAQNLEF